MQFKNLILLAASFGLTFAVPTSETKPDPKTCKNPIVAKYDNIPATAILPFTPVKSPYKGLRYTNFNALGKGLDVTPGSLKPYSTPNSIFFDLLTQLGGGIATIKPAKDKGTFDLISTRFGCSTLLGLTRIPLDCNVIASTVTSKGLRKSTTFKFTKSETMEKFSFPPKQFADLKQVSFVITGQPLLDNTFAATFDNLEYCLH